MSTVTIEVDGVELETLAELLRPGLRAVVVGLNPSNVSVDAGHYFQSRLGLRLWQRLQQAGILHSLPRGGEDDEAFRQGIGFAKDFAAVAPLVREGIRGTQDARPLRARRPGGRGTRRAWACARRR